ncbi:MAG: Lon-like protease helical domain-containing protein, partial [Campylobacterota bacterium]
MTQPVDVTRLYSRCKLEFAFETTDDLDALEGFLNHKRAFESISLAIGLEHEGYNLYVMGESGSGRHFSVEEFIKQKAKNEKTPRDLCYVYNFQNPDKPLAIELEGGQGESFKEDMKKLLDHLKSAIPAMFKSNEYFFK